MTATANTQLINASNLMVGDIISDDVLCKVTDVLRFWDGITIFVEDVNGERYMIRRTPGSSFTVYSTELFESVRSQLTYS